MKNNILYHLTKREYLPSILTKGIIPYTQHQCAGITPTLKHNKVFITNDVDYIARRHAHIEWCKRYDAIVLEIDTTLLTIQSVRYDDGATFTLSDFEFTIGSIPVENIIRVRELTEFLKHE